MKIIGPYLLNKRGMCLVWRFLGLPGWPYYWKYSVEIDDGRLGIMLLGIPHTLGTVHTSARV